MIGRDAWLQRSEDKDLPVTCDFEDRAAAIAAVEIAFGVEGESGCDAHAFHKHRTGALRCNAMDRALVSRGNIEHAGRIDSEACRIHYVGGEAVHVAFRRNP